MAGILFFKDIKFRKNGSAVFKVFFFTEDSKYLCFNGAKKLSQSNISSSLGELNATEIPLNMIEMFVVRVYFG